MKNIKQIIFSILFSTISYSQILDINLSCIDHTDIRTLTGNSMAGVVNSGDKILLFGGYYKCNKPKIDDIVLYRWGNRINLAKSIRAIEGDKIDIRKNKKKQYQLFVNNKPLLNTANEPYVFYEKKKFGVINLFLGTVPKNMVLLMGNNTTASNDSKKFGLIKLKYLAGRFLVLK